MLQLDMVRHTQSWNEVHKFADERLKVWSIKQQSVLPTLLSWIEKSLDGLTYMRTEQPACGVVGTMKKTYFLALITGLMAARPVNSVCIIMHANRASEGKGKKASEA